MGDRQEAHHPLEFCPHCDSGILAEHKREKKKKYTKIIKFCAGCGRKVVCRSYRKADR